MIDYGKRYRLKAERFEHPAGTVVYRCAKHDYGCARDDTVITGVDHVSMTTDPSGDYPFFTVPTSDLELVESD